MNPNSRTGRVRDLLKHLLRPFSRSSERSSRFRSATPSPNALSVNDPPSTDQNPDSSACVVMTSSPNPSLLPSPKQFTSILKTSLNLLNDALNGVPLPGKGAISVVIRIIEIVQVSISSSMNPMCSYNRSHIDGEGYQLISLNRQCEEIGNIIVTALAGKNENSISSHLKDSLDHMSRYEMLVYVGQSHLIQSSTQRFGASERRHCKITVKSSRWCDQRQFSEVGPRRRE